MLVSIFCIVNLHAQALLTRREPCCGTHVTLSNGVMLSHQRCPVALFCNGHLQMRVGQQDTISCSTSGVEPLNLLTTDPTDV